MRAPQKDLACRCPMAALARRTPSRPPALGMEGHLALAATGAAAGQQPAAWADGHHNTNHHRMPRCNHLGPRRGRGILILPPRGRAAPVSLLDLAGILPLVTSRLVAGRLLDSLCALMPLIKQLGEATWGILGQGGIAAEGGFRSP